VLLLWLSWKRPGGVESDRLKHTAAFGVLAREGLYQKPVAVLKVEDNKGNVLQEYKPKKGKKVLDSKIARITNYSLSNDSARSYAFGAGSLLTLPGRPVAAKTGTTNDYHDAWTVGYTPSVVTGVWVGNNDNSPMLKGSSILLATPIWHYFAQKFLKDKPKEKFHPPKINYPNKPMLNGSLVGIYKMNNKYLPQIHNILWYVDKNNPLGAPPKNPEDDPQFKNWEKPVLDWLKKIKINLKNYNQKIPYEIKLKPISLEKNLTSKNSLEILAPKNGDFIKNAFKLKLKIYHSLYSCRIYFNEKLIKNLKNLKKGFLELELKPQKILPQNLLEIETQEERKASSTKKTLILFKKIF